jgi:hypothetical protein
MWRREDNKEARVTKKPGHVITEKGIGEQNCHHDGDDFPCGSPGRFHEQNDQDGAEDKLVGFMHPSLPDDFLPIQKHIPTNDDTGHHPLDIEPLRRILPPEEDFIPQAVSVKSLFLLLGTISAKGLAKGQKVAPNVGANQ